MDCCGQDLWYQGTVAAYCEATETHLIRYDDGDSKWHELLTDETLGQLEWIDAPKLLSVTHHDDTTPHYIVYNADTRLLSMYPDMTVLEDDDIADPQAFAARLAGPPHYLHVPRRPEIVRQVFVRVTRETCTNVPHHACSVALEKLSRMKASEPIVAVGGEAALGAAAGTAEASA